MSDSGGLAQPGREKMNLEEDIRLEIQSAGIPLTVRMLTERLDGPARRTVYNYIDEMDLEEIEYGNATAYWIDERDDETRRVAGQVSSALTVLIIGFAATVGIGYSYGGILGALSIIGVGLAVAVYWKVVKQLVIRYRSDE